MPDETDTIKSLRAELREARCNQRDLRDMLAARNAEIQDFIADGKQLRTALESAGKYFEYLRTHLSLIRQNAEQGENTAAHFAGAYAADAPKRV